MRRTLHLVRRLQSLACAVVTVAVLGGCSGGGSGVKGGNGITDLPPDAVLRQAADAARSASSVHVKGQVRNRDRQVTVLDLRLKGTEGATGRVAVGPRRFDLTRIGKDLYVNGGKGAFDGLGPAAPLLEDRTVQLRADDPRFAELAAFTDLRTMVDTLLNLRGELRKGETRTVNGVPALAIVDASGDVSLWVAVAGEPYPLRLDAPKPTGASGTAGTLDFLEYNRPVELKAPAGAVGIGG